MVRGLFCAGACALAMMGTPLGAAAQVQFGPQVAVGTDSGLGLGARLQFPLRVSTLGVDGTVDGTYFFGGPAGIDQWIDANVNVRLPIPIAADFATRIGAGLNFTHLSFESGGARGTDNDIGLNVLAAIGLPGGNLTPFLELRVIVGGAEQLVFTGGFTVGPRR